MKYKSWLGEYKSWLSVWFAYTLGFVGLAFALVVILERHTGMPLRFTKSISYDIKIKFAKEQLAKKQYDTLIVGSSMALNNIDAEVLEASDAVTRALNLSSWGMATSECLQLLQMLDLSEIKYVVHAAQYFDYVGELDKVLDERELERYFQGRWTYKTYFQNISRLPQNLWDYFDLGNEYGDSRTQAYLGFDESGGVNFERDGFLINKRKWEEIPPISATPVGDDYFHHLLAMQQFLSEKDIQLVVITPPFRENLLAQSAEFRQFFFAHKDYLEHLSRTRGFVYVDAHDKLGLNDQFFVDASHLDAKGAHRMSELVVEAVEHSEVTTIMEL